ncbi:alanine--tRNA ligase [Clavibacter michiganensis]|uniref:Alanine--tRNA ligase n=1 Tax=Clavibacter michiganensis subsp. michiganensis (strain NCPPB 382) TaxID=443906 RepID=SYA_CLAM3|nr:alanine--tRNA ligase [Clavibacter michiganensis]A5CRZ5.1 RecName: Full=Alanine--tRNA ligase; AltName: Full=Alanyl-tRNA synthetase; Short=AlaRS [Clavibacter michiganensis subsp. michiganensis NCPPB 382]MDO4017753.1 alanine--tRNA ligase [Clavibacter michiganensis]MDO4028484.1 alanine--tRNA ligase [Clavibacter michiganensis]MDO4036755.1 alanine--tRNA ligase [Clavibacter michiganensis]MDO4040713.1 alanine--tRNA ligase [Clavibacter michiganensis]MDO4050217.1 alanine--tRNA ligase [Clavibacter mi
MQTADIRNAWLTYFGDRGHTVVPSASLVSDDPTLLFTVAGMVPFVPYLTGVVPAPFPRATSVQKCIRTLDIEEVGRTPRHGTFFQMNGNFSFGDYFKEQAIAYAWELLTTSEADGGLGFSPDDLWVTVYHEDDEARQAWKRIAGLPDERIQGLGRDTNYWHTGQPGPAGPCSEIFFDRGPAYGADGGPATDDDRYVEIWNLVFMQYLRGAGTGKSDFEILGDLPKKNIDTGMGLERVAFLKQGVENMYEIDQVRPVLDRAAELSGRRYGADHEDDVRMRIVADHVRSSLMLMSDGVRPSNEGRGYILRRLMRRTVRAMRLMGVDAATFGELFPASRDAMKAAYPEVSDDFDRISRLAYAEEETFLRTLSGGTTILDVAVGETKAKGGERIAGDTAFLLHDTFGFPIDLTLEMAEENGLTVDREAFDRLMLEQRTRAKADAKSKKTALADLTVYSEFRAAGETRFTGYDELETGTTILGLIVGGRSVDHAVAGDIAEVILPETSLYAESGGQEADAGSIVGQGFDLEVLDVQKPVKGLISHRVQVRSGEVGVGDAATTVVDADWRRGATQAHSGTHLVHAALRQVLGQDAHQSGSYNRAGYMRLDFAWNQALSSETRSEIEDIANGAVRDDLRVVTRVMPIDEAKQLGAMALFGEKYGDTVRVVDIGGPWSRELCAGTHVSSSAQIGLINVVGESSVGSTNRRIESLVGREAFQDLAVERAIVSQLTSTLKTPREQLPDRIADLMQNLKTAERRIADFEAQALQQRVPALLAQGSRVGAVTLIQESLGAVRSADEVRQLVTLVRERAGSEPVVVALAGDAGGKPTVIVATNQAARDAGAKAGQLARAAAAVLGGGGGGKDDLAQGGGSDVSAIGDALTAVRQALAS